MAALIPASGRSMFNWIDRLPVKPLFFIAVIFALLPLRPEPHLFEKLRMLSEGALVRPIDIFDLFLHSLGLILLAIRLIRIKFYGKQ
jgi:hypothetical protein